LLLAASPAAAETSTIYVSPSGADTAAGTQTAPLKTLNAALARATGGQRVQLAPGTYGYAHDERTRTAVVQVVGAGTGQTKVGGLEIFGGQRLTFTGITFTAPVRLQGHPMRHAAQPAADIRLADNEFTTNSTTYCLSIREGARDITVTGNRIHDCTSGILGQGNPYVSSRITIERNTIERITGDGIQFGAWNDVRIKTNVIRYVSDPAGVIHNDAIQMTGASTTVEISRNRLFDSRSQLVLIQDAIGPIDHLNVADNLLAGAGAVAMQIQGATRAMVRSNTIWGGKDGGLWLRAGYLRAAVSVVPTDTVVTNNVTTTMRMMEGATAAAAAGNVVLCPAKYSGVTVPAGAACVVDPRFVDPATKRYALAADSPARALGTSLWLPATDIDQLPFTAPVPGAFR
jgi:hypothetical protein